MLRDSNVASNAACKGIQMSLLLSCFICVLFLSQLKHGYFSILLIPSICYDSLSVYLVCLFAQLHAISQLNV